MNEKDDQKPASVSDETKNDDSFEIPVKKSPIFLFAILNIGLVIFMVILLFSVYQYYKE